MKPYNGFSENNISLTTPLLLNTAFLFKAYSFLSTIQISKIWTSKIIVLLSWEILWEPLGLKNGEYFGIKNIRKMETLNLKAICMQYSVNKYSLIQMSLSWLYKNSLSCMLRCKSALTIPETIIPTNQSTSKTIKPATLSSIFMKLAIVLLLFTSLIKED